MEIRVVVGEKSKNRIFPKSPMLKEIYPLPRDKTSRCTSVNDPKYFTLLHEDLVLNFVLKIFGNICL